MPDRQHLLGNVGRGTRWFAGVVIVAVIGAAATVLVPRALTKDSGPRLCSIRGIADAGYLNAALTGRSKQVVAVAVKIVDENLWYFKAAGHAGESWSVPADPSYLWEVGQPGDPPSTTFIFAMLARSPHSDLRLPTEDQGRQRIPPGFEIVGDEVPLQKREMLRGGLSRSC